MCNSMYYQKLCYFRLIDENGKTRKRGGNLNFNEGP